MNEVIQQNYEAILKPEELAMLMDRRFLQSWWRRIKLFDRRRNNESHNSYLVGER